MCSTRCCGCCCQWRRWCRASGAVGALVCDDERACHQRSLAVADRAAQPCFQNWGVGKGRRFARISVPCTHSPTQVAWSEGRRPLGAVLHSLNEPSEFSQLPPRGHDSSTINIVLVIINNNNNNIIILRFAAVSCPPFTISSSIGYLSAGLAKKTCI